jgi:ankyrin repeat protein
VLLEAPADIDARDPHDWTALHIAADCGNIEIIVMLVEEGADLDAVVCEWGVAGNG